MTKEQLESLMVMTGLARMYAPIYHDEKKEMLDLVKKAEKIIAEQIDLQRNEK